MYAALEHQGLSSKHSMISKPVGSPKASQPTTSFSDNRPQAALQRKVMHMSQQDIPQKTLESRNVSSHKVMQFGRVIRSARRKLNPNSAAHWNAARRAARSAKYAIKFLGVGSRRNVFYATIRYGGRNITYHLVSAGLGGKHPKSKGRSAAHTEQIWRALMATGLIQRHLKMKSKPRVNTIYSRNEACDSNPGDPHGCRSIPTADMGMPASVPFFFTSPYTTGGNNKMATLTQMSKFGDTDREDDSDDEYIDTDMLRGEDLDTLSMAKFQKATKRNPKF